MGLLDQFSEFAKTPEGQGLLSAAFGGLAGARRGTPLNNIGRGGLAGLAGYSGAIDRQSQEGEQAFQKQFRQMQMDDMVAKAQKQKGEQEWRGGLPGVMKQAETSYGAGMEGPTMTPGNPKALDQYLLDPRSPFADDLLKQKIMPKERKLRTVGGVVLDESTMQPVYTTPEKLNPNQPFMIVDGAIVPNKAYQDYETGKAKAGASSVTVNNKVENKASESVAGQVGPILEKSLTSAEGAMRVLDASTRVISAMDSGKVITGPLANARVTGLQIGQMLGVGGRDDADVLANTRQAIRGLSEMTLQGRKEMSGQGAITDRESALAEKATSGDISNLTAAEVKILANASARASRYAIQKHQARVKNAGALPGMGNITPFFDVPPMQQEAAPNAVPTMRWNPQTNKLEQVR